MSIRNLYIVVVVLTASKDAKFWCENRNLSRVMTGTLTRIDKVVGLHFYIDS